MNSECAGRVPSEAASFAFLRLSLRLALLLLGGSSISLFILPKKYNAPMFERIENTCYQKY